MLTLARALAARPIDQIEKAYLEGVAPD